MEILQKRLLTVPSGNDTSLLMHFDGDLKDSSRNNHIASITAGSQYFSFSAPDTPQNGENFGRHLYVSAGNGRIQIPHHESLALGKIWQIDFRLRVVGERNQLSFSIRKTRNFGLWLGNGGFAVYVYDSLGQVVKSTTGAAYVGSLDTIWYHFSLISTGTEISLYRDTQKLYSFSSTNIDCQYATPPLEINYTNNTADYRLDELRILKGRYEIPTEVPTIPYR